jgi:cob(I)alamin adenosyltransferase
MSIATKHGDTGETGLAGGTRISKAALQVESYGTVDELNAVLGFARSLCQNREIAAWTEEIQRSLFRVGAVLATPADSPKQHAEISTADINRLTNLVHQIEATEDILSDWSLPGAHTQSAVYEMARAVCRRAERATVRLVESGVQIQPTIIPYLNRLSDLLWLFGRRIEIDAGVVARLRDDPKSGLKNEWES